MSENSGPSMPFSARRPLAAALLLLAGCAIPEAEAPGGAGLGLAPADETTVEILAGVPLSERIRLGPYGAAFGRPGGAVSRALFDDDSVREELAALAAAHGPFDLAVGTSRVRFRGRGSAPASGAERRRIAEWALFVAAEATGSGGLEPGPVLFWQRGGEGEACDVLGVDRTGRVHGGACDAESGAPRLLAPPELARLYGWFDRLGPFEISWLEGPPGEQRTLRLVFAGAGKATAGASERAEIAAFASALAGELPFAASPRFTPPPRREPAAPLVLPARAPVPPPPLPPFFG